MGHYPTLVVTIPSVRPLSLFPSPSSVPFPFFVFLPVQNSLYTTVYMENVLVGSSPDLVPGELSIQVVSKVRTPHTPVDLEY